MAFGKRRTTFLAAALTALLCGTAACGTSGPTSTENQATAWALTGPDEQLVETSMRNWSEDRPEAVIEPQFYANDAYKQKVRTAIGAGEAPTLLTGWGGGNLRDWVDADRVVDLTKDLGGHAELEETFLPSVLQTGTIDGKVYGVPYNGVQPVTLFYNKELFDQVGAEPPETWQDLMDLVPKFRDADIAPIALGGQSKWPLLMWESYLVGRIGGAEVFDAIAAGEPEAWSDPAVLEANRKLQELVKAGGFVDGFGSIDTDSNADVALLYSGKAAMYLMGSWAYPTIQNDAPDFIEDGKLGYTTFPTVEGGKGNQADLVGNPANFWSVSADASKEEQDAAVRYLKDGMINDSYVRSMLENGSVPPVRGIEKQITKVSDDEYLPWMYSLVDEAPSFQLSWDQALDQGAAQEMLNNLEQLFLRDITPEQFSANMNKTLEP